MTTEQAVERTKIRDQQEVLHASMIQTLRLRAQLFTRDQRKLYALIRDNSPSLSLTQVFHALSSALYATNFPVEFNSPLASLSDAQEVKKRLANAIEKNHETRLALSDSSAANHKEARYAPFRYLFELACSQGNTDLLTAIASVPEIDHNYLTVGSYLYNAIASKNSGMVLERLASLGLINAIFDSNNQYINGKTITPLHYALELAKPEAAEVLLNHFYLNAADNTDAPLVHAIRHYATLAGDNTHTEAQYESIKMLINNGATLEGSKITEREVVFLDWFSTESQKRGDNLELDITLLLSKAEFVNETPVASAAPAAVADADEEKSTRSRQDNPSVKPEMADFSSPYSYSYRSYFGTRFAPTPELNADIRDIVEAAATEEVTSKQLPAHGFKSPVLRNKTFAEVRGEQPAYKRLFSWMGSFLSPTEAPKVTVNTSPVEAAPAQPDEPRKAEAEPRQEFSSYFHGSNFSQHFFQSNSTNDTSHQAKTEPRQEFSNYFHGSNFSQHFFQSNSTNDTSHQAKAEPRQEFSSYFSSR